MAVSQPTKSFFIVASFAVLIVSLALLGIIYSKGIFNSQAPTKSSADGGNQSWSSAQKISNSVNSSYAPAIFTDNNNVSHVVFAQTTSGSNPLWQTFYTNNKSGNWSSPKLLDNAHDYRTSKIVGDPADSQKLYVATGAYTSHYGAGCSNSEGGGCPNIYFLKSTDGGSSWSSPLVVQKDTYDPSLTTDPDGNLYLASGDLQHILVSKRSHDSQNWNNLPSPNIPANTSFPSLTFTNNTLHLLASAGPAGSKKLYYSHFDGESWSDSKIVSENTPSNNRVSTFATFGNGKLVSIYADENEGPIKSITSLNNGSTWTPPQTIGPANSLAPSLSVSSTGSVNAVWQQNVNNSTISFSTFNGASWSSPKTIISLDAKKPAVSAGPNSVNAVASVNGNQYDIFFTGTTSQQSGQAIKINDDSPQITYSGPWEKITDNTSQAFNKDFHMVPKPRLDFAANNDNANASFTFIGNKITVGSLGGTTRGKMDIYIDNVLSDSWNQNRDNTNPITWVSNNLSCGQHTVKVSQSTTPLLLPPSSRPTYHILLDYISYSPCDNHSDQTIHLNDDSSQITYSGPWERKLDKGFDYKYAPAPLSSTTVSKNLGASASLSFTGTKVAFGTLTWINRGFYDISIDGAKVDNWSAYTPGSVAPKKWTSSNLNCSNHTIKVSQSDKSGDNGGKAIVIDYFEYEKCGGSNSPPPTSNGCQGNANASAKCFSCKKDSLDDQVNIYDFSCFAKWYGQNVGK